MKRTGKFFLGLVLVVLLVVAGGLYYVSANLDNIVAKVIEEKGSEATQTPVSVGSVDIDIRGGSGRIAHLSVANPEGFSEGAAIAFGEFSIQMDPMAVTSDPIVIGEIAVTGAQVLMEQSTAGNNLRTLQAALGTQPADDTGAAAGPQVIIERFTLDESQVEVRVPQLDESREVTIPQIVVTDIGRASNGATAAEVARQVLEPIIRKALEAGATAGVEGAVRGKIDEAKDSVTKDLLDRLPAADDEDDQ
ncbi:MAG TPA: hypothetical protein VNQ14_14760 [Woeseiaceae bacterium]|nr:hypothetical protein [Woeseiaceae bacterium]